ncbi:hypothetical protein Gotur_034803 [Gossypium turneri]
MSDFPDRLQFPNFLSLFSLNFPRQEQRRYSILIPARAFDPLLILDFGVLQELRNGSVLDEFVNGKRRLSKWSTAWNSLSSVPKWILSLHGLVSIDLGFNSLKGQIPYYFGNFSFLEVLDLSGNYLNSSVPNSLYSLNHLRFLDLSINEIEQVISKILQSLSSCCLGSLESLNMKDNQLSGHLTDQLGQFKNLAYLSLAQNKISGPIPLSIGELSSLKLFDVSENQLSGTFPPSLGQLSNLETLRFGYNLLEGVILETHFSNLTRLTTLKASQNMLRFESNSSWIPPFQCRTIELGQWHLGPKFPHWLKFQKNSSILDISQAGISDSVPTWFLNLSPQFKYVNLSYNQLAGGISYLNVRDSVDLSSNRFIGPLPRVFPTLRFLILSNNLFSGSLFELVCHSSSRERMEVLFIDKNLLTGEIPDCWNQLESLTFLNLGNNNLTGKIPPSLGRTGLDWLNLRNNSMFGELPSTLQNLTNLRILDLSENHFSGNIPTWIGDKLSTLMILSLQPNNFDGQIPHKICDFQYLQNLDLSRNNILGAIPKCFSNLSAMANRSYDNNYSYDWGGTITLIYLSALLVLKGREDEYSSILGLVTSMDLSANSLTGEIPKEIGILVELRSLNLSGNLLIGNIPDEIGNMELMESLDLPMNQLNGEIPPSFSNLNFLNHFNVSYNNLTGQIPTSTQLQSFENISYMGNYLCGPPLTKNCSTKGLPTDVANNGSSSEGSKVNWLYVLEACILSKIGPCWSKAICALGYYRKLVGEEKVALSQTGQFSLWDCFDMGADSIACAAKEVSDHESVTELDWWLYPFDGPHSTPKIIHRNLVSWTPSPVNKLKSNVDGSAWGKPCPAGCGGILQKNNIDFQVRNDFSFFVEFEVKDDDKSESWCATILRALWWVVLGDWKDLPLQDNNKGMLLASRFFFCQFSFVFSFDKDEIGNMEFMESLMSCPVNIELIESHDIGQIVVGRNWQHGVDGIPLSFSNLNFLNHFNMSCNNLTGQIPTSTRLQSFEKFSYMGNHLCGPPLTKNCGTKGISTDVPNNGRSNEGSKVNWLYVSIVLGLVIGFWGVVAPLYFIRS